jgi:penicillin-binding protein 1A
VTVKLLDDIGVNYAIQYAKRLGITSQLTPTLALALGASGVTLWELLTAYSPFANLGDRVEPYMIEKIFDRNGRLLEDHQVNREAVISPQTAYIMTNLLQGVIEEGTGTKAKQLGRPAAGKTGTTNELKDAWFIGFTPNLLAGVWLGYDDHNVSLGKGETGGRAACPIWLSFMEQALKDVPVLAFKIPPGIHFARVGGSEESPGVYMPFSGDAPIRRARPQPTETEEDSSSSSASSQVKVPSDSFFKSDLF